MTEKNEPELQEVKIGTVNAQADYRRIYRFRGEEVASVRDYLSARNRDDRGTDKTLYRVGDDKYLILIEDWSRWESEAGHSYLVKDEAEDPEDTRPRVFSGREVAEQYPDLANQAELCFPIDLDLEEA